ncbi:hypothetical protein CEXT_233731 [Caerostris extrusa]|uniref:Uncharacterized protein n=1 Tax=Caerostris extrusa TaxID=172846 RepID=A0AAV4VZM5_CAEEX|nr:hypothetical protein CEXT_233731 [Caerostris extrusa]
MRITNEGTCGQNATEKSTHKMPPTIRGRKSKSGWNLLFSFLKYNFPFVASIVFRCELPQNKESDLFDVALTILCLEQDFLVIFKFFECANVLKHLSIKDSFHP